MKIKSANRESTGKMAVNVVCVIIIISIIITTSIFTDFCSSRATFLT